MKPQFLDRQPLLDRLTCYGLDDFAELIQKLCLERFEPQRHGMLAKWEAAWRELPECAAEFDLQSDSVTVKAVADNPYCSPPPRIASSQPSEISSVAEGTMESVWHRNRYGVAQQPEVGSAARPSGISRP